MNQRRLCVFVLLLITSSVLVSGCLTGNGESTGNGGVNIVRFESNMPSVQSGENVRFYVSVENTGDAASKVVAGIIGIDANAWGISEASNWQYLGELFPVRDEVAGETADYTWDAKAPPVATTSFQFQPVARVYYTYETSASKPIWFVSGDELERIIRSGETLESGPTAVSSGPVSVDIRTGDFVKAGSGAANPAFYLQIHIENSGGGFIEGSESPVFIYLEAPAGTELNPEEDCSLSTYSGLNDHEVDPVLSKMGWTIEPGYYYTKLWDGKSKDIVCEVRIQSMPVIKEARYFNVRLYYMYYKDISTSITVKR